MYSSRLGRDRQALTMPPLVNKHRVPKQFVIFAAKPVK